MYVMQFTEHFLVHSTAVIAALFKFLLHQVGEKWPPVYKATLVIVNCVLTDLGKKGEMPQNLGIKEGSLFSCI